MERAQSTPDASAGALRGLAPRRLNWKQLRKDVATLVAGQVAKALRSAPGPAFLPDLRHGCPGSGFGAARRTRVGMNLPRAGKPRPSIHPSLSAIPTASQL